MNNFIYNDARKYFSITFMVSSKNLFLPIEIGNVSYDVFLISLSVSCSLNDDVDIHATEAKRKTFQELILTMKCNDI
jgi:hypothetical protein